jgi:hypothetical protein
VRGKTFPATLAHTGKHGDALVALDHRMDQLHHEDRLADPGTAEHRGLAALRERCQQVDHLDAGREDLGGRALRSERWRHAVNRAAGHAVGKGRAAVAGHSRHVDQAAEHRFTHGNTDRCTGCAHGGAAAKSVGRAQGEGAHRALVQMRLHLGHDRRPFVGQDFERLVEQRQSAISEGDVHHRATDRRDAARVRLRGGFVEWQGWGAAEGVHALHATTW